MLKSQNQYVIFYIGFCVDEKERFEKRKDGNTTEIYPLADFNIEEKTILQWAKNEPIFNSYYKFNDRCGCMFCPLASRKNLAYLAKFYPEQFEIMIKLMEHTEKIRSIELGRKFCIMDSRGKYDAKYIKENVLNKHLPKLNEMLENEIIL